mmetsp:Transcript_19474/g.45312  ORF Transcript_19474/g.45312 Transcript_19474/m.45312 type:complete len:248 (-) Transcript_19474:510-1253(-)
MTGRSPDIGARNVWTGMDDPARGCPCCIAGERDGALAKHCRGIEVAPRTAATGGSPSDCHDGTGEVGDGGAGILEKHCSGIVDTPLLGSVPVHEVTVMQAAVASLCTDAAEVILLKWSMVKLVLALALASDLQLERPLLPTPLFSAASNSSSVSTKSLSASSVSSSSTALFTCCLYPYTMTLPFWSVSVTSQVSAMHCKADGLIEAPLVNGTCASAKRSAMPSITASAASLSSSGPKMRTSWCPRSM